MASYDYKFLFVSVLCVPLCEYLFSRKAWIALGGRSKEEAQMEVVQLLEGVCPSLKDAVLKCLEEASQTKPENR